MQAAVTAAPEIGAWPRPAPGNTSHAGCLDFGRLAIDSLQPNVLVRWAFNLSVFLMPFTRFYLPGTGDRLGVVRLVQLLILCAVVSQPRVCLRLVPVALLWFLAYCGVRILAGLWFTPEMSFVWWPDTVAWLQFSFPWLWVAFNVLQFPNTGRQGLWSLIWGCSLCAVLHIAGIGVVEVTSGVEGRSTVFGENANVVGTTYAIAAIALVGLALPRDANLHRRLLLLPLFGVLGIGMAKTGSRTALMVLAMGAGILLFQGGSLGSRTRRLAISLLVGALLAGILWQIPSVMKRFENLDAATLQRQEGRVRMIPVLWEIFLRSPVYGSGPDGYRFELTRRAMPGLIKDQRMIAAHNLVLLLLVETGIIGFLLFSSGVKAALTSAWRARFRPGGFLPLALILPMTIAGALVSDPSHHAMFWLAMAYALAGSA